jgi:hydroxymethylglutaryl-CoA synthase
LPAPSAAVLALAVRVPRRFLRLPDLAAARGADPDKYRSGLGCLEMGVPAPGSDAVTLAAGAARRLLADRPEEAARVGLCVVGTESGVDRAKPVAIWVHELAGLPRACSAFDVKHACYGGTAALRMALAWVAANPDRRALVVAADIARYPIGSPGEPTQGAGAVAMLVGYDGAGEAAWTPSPVSGTCARQVGDFWQPLYLRDARVRGRVSIEGYLAALDGALADYRSRAGDEPPPDHLIVHAPFPGMARKAHRQWAAAQGIDAPAAVAADFRARVAPWLWVNERLGNAYAASVFLSLAGLAERLGPRPGGRRIAMFSYGSGSCGEYCTGRLGGGAAPVVGADLDARAAVTVGEYEALRAECLALEADGSLRDDPEPSGDGATFLGVRDDERRYRRD